MYIAHRIGTLNVYGIRNKIEREKIFHSLKRKSYDIEYLQETHCANESEAFLWAKSWEGNITWNNGSTQSRVVAIFIKNIDLQLQVVENSLYNDEHGRIISLRANLSERSYYQYTDVYTPNAGIDRKWVILTVLLIKASIGKGPQLLK
ncbi:YTX2-like protein [Mya arenaria]|uniref:YTX2-like protein n=1 Tax=Mya arenaria TaxID=6604 RepID=A0ABY7F0Q0_MYAAR|nr:YTX2-like protein [Mya arenaria]